MTEESSRQDQDCTKRGFTGVLNCGPGWQQGHWVPTVCLKGRSLCTSEDNSISKAECAWFIISSESDRSGTFLVSAATGPASKAPRTILGFLMCRVLGHYWGNILELLRGRPGG